MSTAGSGAAVEELWQPKVNPWIIAGAVSLAAFMEVLDTSIANVALPHIAGGLASSNDESTWVLTRYLVSNALVILPLSGWLVASLGKQAVLSNLHYVFYSEFLSLWDRTEPWVSAPVSSHAGRVWGRPSADGAVHPGR